MKKHTLKISTVSLVCVLCAGISAESFAAASVRTLGGTGTVNGTASAGTSTRATSSTRAGSLRVVPSSARLTPTSSTAKPSTATNTKPTNTTQRLSIGKYLGGATTTTGTSAAATAEATGQLQDRIEALESIIEGDPRNQQPGLEDRVIALEGKTISGDGVVIVEDDIVSVDVDALIKKMWGEDALDASREVEIEYTDGHDLRWRYTTGDDTEWNTLFNTDALVGDYATDQDLSDAIAAVATTYATKTELEAYELASHAAETYQVKALVTTIDENSDDTHYPSAAAVRTAIADATSDLATADNVYTKAEANALLDTKADKSTTYTKTETDTALSGKANKATTLAGYGINDAYTKTQVDTAIENATSDLATAENVYTKAEADALLDAKANAAYVAEVYETKEHAAETYLTEHQDISGKADKATTLAGYGIENAYTKTEINEMVEGISGEGGSIKTQIDTALADYTTTADLESNYAQKADTLAGYGIGDAYTKTETDNLLEAKADSADLATVATTGSFNDLNNKPTTVAEYGITDTYTKTEANTLLNDKADKSDTYTKAQVEEKLEAISGDNGSISQQITAALNDYTPTAGMAQVALSGSYTDLSNKPVIDSALSLTSTNAVQNSTITEYLKQRFSDESLEMLASGEWVFGFVGGQPQYIKVVDANGN